MDIFSDPRIECPGTENYTGRSPTDFRSMTISTLKSKPENGPASSGNCVAPITNNSRKRFSETKKKHLPDRIFICPICNRWFDYKHVLQNHERTHTGEKPFNCSVCSTKFARVHHLQVHMRIHTGEKPFHCNICGKTFNQVSNLRRHLLLHSDDRPFPCEFCTERILCSGQLKKHTRIHIGETLHYCEDCHQHFLRRHELVHHKCYPYSQESNETSAYFPQPSPEIPSVKIHRRKSSCVRRIVRQPPELSVNLDSEIIPEQTHPMDLSLGSHRSPHFAF